ncbi:pyrimidine 5-nucleotidase [Ramicandelaber brevisporus]|nr:pyrimidine 5-nucleotidase [Ramicandelaber brevisporus]
MAASLPSVTPAVGSIAASRSDLLAKPGRPSDVFFFDIDNCLYPMSTGIARSMRDLIIQFAITHSGISVEDAPAICANYYKNYGLCARGLIIHHNINPVEFNDQVDGRLPIEDVIKPDPELRGILERLVTRRWAFTNAGIDHGRRVLAALGIDDLFEGITYCDYAEPNFACKPELPAYRKALNEAGLVEMAAKVPQDENSTTVANGYAPGGSSSSDIQCYFVDDSATNVQTAEKLGWISVHINEPAADGAYQPHDPLKQGEVAGSFEITSIHQLPAVLPHLFN